MSPEARGQNLLYISDLGANSVIVYTYPKGKLVGEITDFGSVATLCANNAGDVFVVDEAGPVDVYAHGGTSPIRRLQSSGAPNGCSLDPTSGNLAVTNQSSLLYGTVSIYAKAKGKPKAYFNDMVDATFFCGYDNAGNLFMDGWNKLGSVIFLELPKRGKTFRIMKLGRSIDTPGGVVWDGKYIAVGDKGAGLIYRTTARGNIVQTVKLHGDPNLDQFWIQGSTIIGPNAQSGGTALFFHYPAGGSPIRAIAGFSYPIGAAVSLAR